MLSKPSSTSIAAVKNGESTAPLSKKVKVESSSTATSNPSQSTISVSVAINRLAESLAKESVSRLQSLAPSRLHDEVSSQGDSQGSVSEEGGRPASQRHYRVNEWDPMVSTPSAASSISVSDSKSTHSSKDASPLDLELYAMLEAGLSSTVLENYRISLSTWL